MVWRDWLAHILAPMFGKGVLRQDADTVFDGA